MPSKAPRIPDPQIVDPERIEQQLAEKLIGQRIRGFRLGRSMGLAELSKLTGLSASYISQLETGRVVPTLRNLARIALVFNKDLAWFFEPRTPVIFRKLRKEDRIPITRKLKKDSHFISESLSSLIPDRHIVPCLAEFHPKGGECGFTPKIFRGTEFLFLIEGEIEILLANQRHTLQAGDVCWIDAGTSRQYLCIGTSSAKAIIITEHPK